MAYPTKQPGMDTTSGYGYNAQPLSSQPANQFSGYGLGSAFAGGGPPPPGVPTSSGYYGTSGLQVPASASDYLAAILAASRLSVPGSGGSGPQGIDPGLIANEFAARRDIANQGYANNNLQFTSAGQSFQRQLAEYQKNQKLFGNQISDIGLARKQNSYQIQGYQQQQAGVRQQEQQAKLQNKSDLFQLLSAATAAGSMGAYGTQFNQTLLGQTLASQLAQLETAYNRYGTDISQAQLQDKRLAGQIQDVLANQAYNTRNQQLNYGDLLISGQQRDLANALIGKNINLLNAQQAAQMASNARANQGSPGSSGALATLAQRNQYLGAANQFLGNLMGQGYDTTALQQQLSRALRGG